MFCPKCGAADQTAKAYCRFCGIFLPDINSLDRRETTIEEHLKINSFFSLASAVVGIALAITLYASLISPHNAPVVVYITFAFLIAMSIWQIQTFIRTRIVKKQVAKLKPKADVPELTAPAGAPASQLVEGIDTAPFTAASVTERTTKNLTKVR